MIGNGGTMFLPQVRPEIDMHRACSLYHAYDYYEQKCTVCMIYNKKINMVVICSFKQKPAQKLTCTEHASYIMHMIMIVHSMYDT